MKNNIQAILFDYDGTLVDTESISAKLYPIIFKKYGYNLTYKQALELRSLGHYFRPDLLSKMLNINFSEKEYSKIEKEFRKMFDNYITKHKIQLKPYCVEILDYLSKKKLPIVIVTGTRKNRVEKQLKKLNIRDYFDDVISVDFLERGKPDPEVYHIAATSLNLIPKYCLAIEDCPNGIMSACQAGCQTIMIPDLTKPDSRLKKNYKFKVIKSLKDLKKII